MRYLRTHRLGRILPGGRPHIGSLSVADLASVGLAGVFVSAGRTAGFWASTGPRPSPATSNAQAMRGGKVMVRILRWVQRAVSTSGVIVRRDKQTCQIKMPGRTMPIPRSFTDGL